MAKVKIYILIKVIGSVHKILFLYYLIFNTFCHYKYLIPGNQLGVSKNRIQPTHQNRVGINTNVQEGDTDRDTTVN